MLKEERTLQGLQFLTLLHPSHHTFCSHSICYVATCSCVLHERWLLQTEYSCHIRTSLSPQNHQTRNVSFFFLTTDPSTASRCLASFPIIKVKQSHYRPGQVLEGFRRLRILDFNRHMKVVSLSALRTGRLYPPGNIPGTHFC